ncbi:MAG TPA: hypothetical protein VK731_11015 [Candidatus Cybelea sp.]|jgi:hypothetical protein|nr:hypothetical protein [Candidatus Cybelea sp.]
MRQKKRIAFVALLIVIACAVFLFPKGHAPQIVGSFTPKDLAEIKGALHRQIWQGTFPNLSWKSLKEFPGAVVRNAKMRVQSIVTMPNGTVHAFASYTTAKHTHGRMSSYDLRRGPTGWEATTEYVTDY